MFQIKNFSEMFPVEVKHAFGMFLRKTFNKIKHCFPDAASEPVKGCYDLLQGEDVKEKANKHNIAEAEGVPGNFQVRIVQTEKEVELHAFALHNWEEPSVNDDSKTWGMLKIPMVIQNSYAAMAEKFLVRKIEFYLNISYLQKKISDKENGKLLISKDNAGKTTTKWENVDVFESRAL
jgi:hypothetical protein